MRYSSFILHMICIMTRKGYVFLLLVLMGTEAVLNFRQRSTSARFWRD